MWIKIIVVFAFIGIIASLASGLYYLVNDKGDSRRTLRALTWRIGLSVALFVFLMVMIAFGIIEPHGIYPNAPVSEAPRS
ncbi:MAG: twin transmembrane helix small protein [Chromatiaceae bacterium]|nr:twin transmembrane helix small protein [Gammaproteobacteria bacterium]MCP5317853.1 twin transmembrane helix small protein [Chromatiaceae bacterium]MCW5587611.1 twin transmembrane helix small protein [Chromatiales bacterium]MCP5429132.1 twin transmembrane helix small protein [Chromatiaceae bacterium]MCP5434675.1 twin transmembrane helix small protein [Chromatiaceae bacterium]